MLFFCLAAGVTAGALLLHYWQVIPPEPDPAPTPHNNDGLTDQVQNTLFNIERLHGEAGVDENFSTIQRQLQQLTFEVSLAQAKQSLRHLESAETRWSTLLDETLHDTAGKQIARDEELLLRFIALRKLPLPFQSQVTAAELQNQIDGHTKPSSSDNVESLTRNMEIAERTGEYALVLFAFHQARVDQLKELRDSARSVPPGEYDLFAKYSMRAAALTNNVNAAAEKAKNETEALLEGELNELKKERDNEVAMVAHLQLQLVRVQKGDSLTTLTEKEAPVPLATRQDFQKEFDRIRTDLVAFITPGYAQPESADQIVHKRTKQPVSYSALRRVGALEDSEKGLAILLRIGGSKSATQRNDRPLGSFPRMNSIAELRKPSVRIRVKEAQRLLRDYGPILVEDGLLAP